MCSRLSFIASGVISIGDSFPSSKNAAFSVQFCLDGCECCLTLHLTGLLLNNVYSTYRATSKYINMHCLMAYEGRIHVLVHPSWSCIVMLTSMVVFHWCTCFFCARARVCRCVRICANRYRIIKRKKEGISWHWSLSVTSIVLNSQNIIRIIYLSIFLLLGSFIELREINFTLLNFWILSCTNVKLIPQFKLMLN